MRKLKLNVALLGLAMVLPACSSEDGSWRGQEEEDPAPAPERTGSVTEAFSSTSPTLSVGARHACALQSGRVLCWGANDVGQLGNGTVGVAGDGQTKPTFVSGITTATALAVGEDHACAVLSTGSIQCWGDNSYGELGNNTKTNASVPVT